MKAIGFRAEKDMVYWAVVEGTTDDPVLIEHSKFKAPVSYDEPNALVWFRGNLRTLLAAKKPDIVACRCAEPFLKAKPAPNAFASMLARARIEGVVLEVSRSEGIKVQAGALAVIRTGLGTKSAKAYLKGDDLRGLDWSKIRNEKIREAILAAASALGA
jgi:hypothetical protein